MSDYTPTTEVVKDAACFPRNELGAPRGIGREAFDRWLAQERAQAKAEALRDAADAFEGGAIDVTIFGDSPQAKWWEAVEAEREILIASLRGRADDLEGK